MQGLAATLGGAVMSRRNMGTNGGKEGKVLPPEKELQT